MEDAAKSEEQMSRRRLRTAIPLLVFVGIAVFLGIELTKDPRLVPSPLVGKPVPQFDLPPVEGRTDGLSNEKLKGDVSMVNVFASWCAACRQEHPLLMALSRNGSVPIHGLNYTDQPDDASAWLDALGDPYTHTDADIDGLMGIDWGVYGVPETFLIDSKGLIRYKHIGPITVEVYRETLEPLINELHAEMGRVGENRI